MRVAILGAGGVALASAANLAANGHSPVVWSPSGAGTAALADAPLTASGVVEAAVRVDVAAEIGDALAGADAVLLALPANGHRAVIDRALPHLCGQPVIVSAELSFGAVYLATRLAERGILSPVIAWSTTVLLGRRTGPAAVTVGGLRSRVDMASVSPDHTADALGLCEALFGPRFHALPLIAAELSNLNPPIHMASALVNFTRIEKAEAWANYDGITAGAARLITALDAERLALAARCGVAVRTADMHYRLTFGFPEGLSIAAMAAAVHEKRKGPPGPTSLDSRFITEDLPFGIAPLVALGDVLGVPTPLHRSGLALLSTLCGRPFAEENDLLPHLDLREILTAAEVRLAA